MNFEGKNNIYKLDEENGYNHPRSFRKSKDTCMEGESSVRISYLLALILIFIYIYIYIYIYKAFHYTKQHVNRIVDLPPFVS